MNRDLPAREQTFLRNSRKVAIVTGASSGVGWAAAVGLAREGYDLCVLARRQEPLEQLGDQLRGIGAECLVIPGDVTRQEDVERAVSSCLERFGRIDVLVNDAAVQVYAKFEDYTWEEIARITDINYFGYLRFARAVLPHFRAQGSGVIVNVLSVMDQGGLQYFSMYAAAKHALLGWAKCLKLELHGTGVKVGNVVLPALNTPLYDHCQSKIGCAPKPLPPVYPVDLAVRSILKTIRSPKMKRIPAFLQGTLILWTDYVIPSVGNMILFAIGEKWQRRPEAVPPDRGNLWAPLPEGTGPTGSLKVTPRWKRYSPLAVPVAAAALWLFYRQRRVAESR